MPACLPSPAACRGIAMAPFRLFFPHAIVFGSILKWLRIVPSEGQRFAGQPPLRRICSLRATTSFRPMLTADR